MPTPAIHSNPILPIAGQMMMPNLKCLLRLGLLESTRPNLTAIIPPIDSNETGEYDINYRYLLTSLINIKISGSSHARVSSQVTHDYSAIKINVDSESRLMILTITKNFSSFRYITKSDLGFPFGTDNVQQTTDAFRSDIRIFENI